MDKLYPTKILPGLLIVLLLSVAVFNSCKKSDNNTGTSTSTPPDLSTKVSSSVSGFVTDENDAAVSNATVQFGAAMLTTDKYGYFEAKNIDVIKDAATVTVTKAGYFKGIKTYIAEAGKSAFFRIKLIPKTIAGTISANAGGTVTLTNGLSISLPANAVVNAATNAAYTGTINLAAYWINPTSSDLPNIMPGDLRGINTDGNVQLLTTYGMAAVELTGSGGELLQIASGKTATVSFPIPTALSSSAPASIPLWYFDEAKGLWQQEGTATKSGDSYVGEVSHFSFWNCDQPGNYVQFNCTIVNGAGLPVQNAQVKISLVNNPNNFRYGYTNSSGYVSGAVPSNAFLQMDVLGSPCFFPVFTQQFYTTTVPVSLGNISIPTGNNVTATLSGTVINCSNAPVSNGYITVYNGNSFLRTALSNTGTYNVTVVLCNTAAVNATLVAEDITTAQQSMPVNYAIVAGNNSVPVIQACGISTQEFINYSIDATSYNFTTPADSIFRYPHPIAQWVWLSGRRIPFNPNNVVTILMDNLNITATSSQTAIQFSCPQLPTGSSVVTPAFIQMTEFGPVGQFLAGNFSFVVKEPSPSTAVHNVSGNFRIRRGF